MPIIDTAHGHGNVIDTVREIKAAFPDVDPAAGNVATAEGARALAEAGADGLKVGMGPASICTTRVVSGVGVPQLTAIAATARIAKEFDIPLIADGGIKFSGDIPKALAAGADSVMIGGLFAGTGGEPRRKDHLYQGRALQALSRHGLAGSDARARGQPQPLHAGRRGEHESWSRKGSRAASHKGPLSFIVAQLVGGLKAGMGYVGCRTIQDLQDNARFMRVSNASLQESHVHDVFIAKEAPNYQRSNDR